MSRQKTFDQQKVLVGARNLFWEKGYEKTSLSDLLEVMQIHKKSFYDTFGSKKELFIKALQNYHDEVIAMMTAEVSREATGLGKIRRVFEVSLEFDGGMQRGCMLVNTISDNYEGSAEIRDLIMKWTEEIKTNFAAFLKEDKRSGLLSPSADIEAEASRLSNAFTGFRLQLKMCKSRSELVELINCILAVYPLSAGIHISVNAE